MADPRTDEAALAIAVEKGCGLIVDCAIVLCSARELHRGPRGLFVLDAGTARVGA